MTPQVRVVEDPPGRYRAAVGQHLTAWYDSEAAALEAGEAYAAWLLELVQGGRLIRVCAYCKVELGFTPC